MEGKEAIKKLVKLTYISAFLKSEKPISLLLVAPPEQSKTHYLLSFKTKHSHLSTDLSYSGLTELLVRNNKIKHIVVPDFLKVTEKNQSTKKSIISFLNAYLEEGIYNINLANKQEINLKGRSGGIITSTTKESFFQNMKNWSGLGFKSRFIIASYEYSKETMQELIKKIVNEESTKNQEAKILSYRQKYIKINPECYNEIVQFSDNSPRKLKNLKVLCKALALLNGNDEVTQKEVYEIGKLNKYLNIRFNKI